MSITANKNKPTCLQLVSYRRQKIKMNSYSIQFQNHMILKTLILMFLFGSSNCRCNFWSFTSYNHILLFLLADSNFTYFIKGDNYYKFHNFKVAVLEGYPRSFKADWLKCDSPVSPSEKTKVLTSKPSRRDVGSSSKLIAIICVCIIGVALVIASVSYVMWRRQRWYRKAYSNRKYCSGRTGTSVHVLDNGEKTVCVTSMQQKWRLMRFSLQGKVWYLSIQLWCIHKLLLWDVMLESESLKILLLIQAKRTLSFIPLVDHT